ncbi:MAG: molybdate ABC transporter permease subunit, partial [Cyanobacteria bacterium J06607_10]
MPLFISLKVSLLATLLTVVTAVPTAYGLSRYLSCHRGRGAALIDSLLLLPLVLPPTVIGFGLLWLLGAQGPLGFLATNVVFTWRAAVLTAFVVSFPLMYRAARAAFSQIDESLFGVARTLGASEWRVFYQVALPLAKPGMLSGVLLSFARSLGEFGATLMLAGNIPGKTQTLPMAVYFAVEGGDFRTAAQWSGVMGAIALFTVFLANYVSDLSTLPTLTFPLMTPPLRKDSPEEEVSRSSTQDFLAQTEQQGTPSKVIPSKVIPLTVDITKTLSRFTLRIQFSTSDALIGILGASGAGKSLLLRCLAGVETPDSGRIVLGDRILYDSDRNINLPSRQRKIALLFQNYALFPHLTVAQNVAFGAKGTDADTKRQVSAELAAVEMAAFAQHYYPHQLSGGQQQRIALARALVSRPDLLLLDEPFSALDVHLRSRLGQQLFQRLAHYSGTTLLVSHHLSEAYRTDQLLVIDQGEVIGQAGPVEVFERPHRCAIAKLTGPLNQSSAYLVGPDYPIEPDSGLCLRADDWQMTLRLSPTSEIPSEMPSLTSSLTS